MTPEDHLRGLYARLLEAATQLPAVRVHTDPVAAAEAADQAARVWYNAVVKEIPATPG